jgi:CHAT domain-containing protein
MTNRREVLQITRSGVAVVAGLVLLDGGVGALGVLTYVTDEVRHARQVVGAAPESARAGAAPTEAALKSPEAARYKIVHLAAHAVADEIVPRRSAVLLTPEGADDGLLQVSEIANLIVITAAVAARRTRAHIQST